MRDDEVSGREGGSLFPPNAPLISCLGQREGGTKRGNAVEGLRPDEGNRVSLSCSQKQELAHHSFRAESLLVAPSSSPVGPSLKYSPPPC